MSIGVIGKIQEGSQENVRVVSVRGTRYGVSVEMCLLNSNCQRDKIGSLSIRSGVLPGG